MSDRTTPLPSLQASVDAVANDAGPGTRLCLACLATALSEACHEIGKLKGINGDLIQRLDRHFRKLESADQLLADLEARLAELERKR